MMGGEKDPTTTTTSRYTTIGNVTKEMHWRKTNVELKGYVKNQALSFPHRFIVASTTASLLVSSSTFSRPHPL